MDLDHDDNLASHSPTASPIVVGLGGIFFESLR